MPELPGFPKTDAPLGEWELNGAELLLGVRFPEAFRAIASQYDGVSGDAEFEIPDGNRLSPAGIGLWLSLRPWSKHSLWAWLAEWPEHGLPGSVVPFGEDGGGNLVCLDYRSGEIPTVTFWFHELTGEDGLYSVAESFQAWLTTITAVDEG